MVVGIFACFLSYVLHAIVGNVTYFTFPLSSIDYFEVMSLKKSWFYLKIILMERDVAGSIVQVGG